MSKIILYSILEQEENLILLEHETNYKSIINRHGHLDMGGQVDVIYMDFVKVFDQALKLFRRITRVNDDETPHHDLTHYNCDQRTGSSTSILTSASCLQLAAGR